MKSIKIGYQFLLIICILIIGTDIPFAQNDQSLRSMGGLWGENNGIYSSLGDRAKHFDNSNIGMFIHLGIYSEPAGFWNKQFKSYQFGTG